MMTDLAEVYTNPEQRSANVRIETIKRFEGNDLNDICDATEATISGTYGFSIGFFRCEPINRYQLESYFKGVLLVPERQLIIGRFDGMVVGSIQLVKPAPSNQTSSFACSVDNHFVAPWARGYGIAKKLLLAAEEEARKAGLSIIKLSVRATREAAINLYESLGYVKWGTLDKYEITGGEIVAGHFYYKDLTI